MGCQGRERSVQDRGFVWRFIGPRRPDPERPTGEPQAIKAWFYPADRYGYELVYPKDQAMRIAKATHGSVLAQNETMKEDADAAARAGATVGRVNETGQFEEGQTARAEQASAPTPDPAQAAPPPATASQPSANRTDASATNQNAAPRPTAGAGSANRTVASASSNESAAPRPTDAAGPARATAGTSGELPNTASSLPLVQLLAALSLAGAVGVHQLRKRRAGASRV